MKLLKLVKEWPTTRRVNVLDGELFCQVWSAEDGRKASKKWPFVTEKGILGEASFLDLQDAPFLDILSRAQW